MNKAAALNVLIREINPQSSSEISLITSWMRQTLVELLGYKDGTTLYSLDWLNKQVLWHADPKQHSTKIFLVEGNNGQILAHALAQVKKDENLNSYGCFSLVFVEPESRNKGLASLLLSHAESWLKKLKMSKITCDTPCNHYKMIQIFQSHGYHISKRYPQQVQLTKYLN